MPSASVVVPVFNAENFVENMVSSILGQTFGDLELILIDDCSTDQSLKIINRLSEKDRRIKVIANGVNKGSVASRNLGIDAARGDWIAMMDHDDWWDRRRLACLLDAAEQTKSDIVADNQFFVTDERSKPWGKLFPERGPATRDINIDDYLRNDMPGQYDNWGKLKYIVRKSFLTEHGLRFEKAFPSDNVFLLNCFLHDPRFTLLSEPLYYYCVRSGSVSLNIRVPDLRNAQDINHRFLELFRAQGRETTCRLLRERIDRMDRYIRYRTVILPAKAGQWGVAARRAAQDIGVVPHVSLMLLKSLVRRTRKTLLHMVAPPMVFQPARRDRRPS